MNINNMKPLLVLLAILQFTYGASIIVPCPDSCTCHQEGELLSVRCTSYEFIKKLTPKQINTIVNLDLNGLSLLNVDAKLKYLKNLNSLDLSNNDIATLRFPYLPKLKKLNVSGNYLKDIALAELPKNLETIDVSRNFIAHFPKDWTKALTIDLYDNPIDCDCSNLLSYDQMILGGVRFAKNLTCQYPKEFKGWSLDSVNCSLITDHLLNSMLGDEAGSGEPDLNVYDDESSVSDPDKDEFLNADEKLDAATTESPYEGSGDEGSGDGLIPILPIEHVPPKACHINCSTAKPLGIDDIPNASPPPGLKEQFGIIYEDLFGTPETTTAEPSLKEAEEPLIVKESDKNEVETFPTNDTVTGEMERASVAQSQNEYIFIILGLAGTFIVCALFLSFLNRRKKRRLAQLKKRNLPSENGHAEEMKPLELKDRPPMITVPYPKHKPEEVPFLNGNGKEKNNIPKVHQAPDDDTEDDVEIRKPTQELLTPQLERVTIRAGEIPDSIPKTPLLVHRSLNSDGEIITTTISN